MIYLNLVEVDCKYTSIFIYQQWYKSICWKGSSWQLGMCIRYFKLLWSSVSKLTKKFSTSFNLKQEGSSGEMKIDLKRVGLYRKMDLTLVVMKDELWSLIFTPCMAIQVCFKRVNTLKSMLMHPKDKISMAQKKDVVYNWECQANGCNSSYIRETSRTLGERVKEHSKLTTSAILKHCTDFHRPLPSIPNISHNWHRSLSKH